MANKWIVHIKKTMKRMKAKGTYKKGLGLKQVILAAKKTWHKGGADEGSASDEDKPTPAMPEAAPPPEMGGRRRRRGTRKTRRRSRR